MKSRISVKFVMKSSVKSAWNPHRKITCSRGNPLFLGIDRLCAALCLTIFKWENKFSPIPSSRPFANDVPIWEIHDWLTDSEVVVWKSHFRKKYRKTQNPVPSQHTWQKFVSVLIYASYTQFASVKFTQIQLSMCNQNES